MEGLYLHNELNLFSGRGRQWSGLSPSIIADVPPLGKPWEARVCPTSPVSLKPVTALKFPHQPPTEASRHTVEDYRAPVPSPADAHLHIFCPGRARTQRRAGRALDSSRNPSTRRNGRQAPLSSPSKFELTAVAAICSPRYVPSPVRYRAPQATQFPSAHSFVPGQQLSCSNLTVVDESLAAVRNTPRYIIRRPGRGNRGAPSLASPTRSKSPVKGYPGPFPAMLSPHAQCEAQYSKIRDDDRHSVRQFDELPVEPNSMSWRASEALACSSAVFRTEVHHQPAGIGECGESCRFQEGPINSYFNMGVAGTRLAYTAAMQQPLGESNTRIGANAASQAGWQASFPVDYSASVPILNTVGQVDTSPQGSPGDATESLEPAAEVVTVHGTERFWELMENLIDLQRGPTSLLSSRVTFDSVVLPGGELQYSLIEQGSFGRVFVGSHQGSKVAIKVPVESMLRTDPAGVMERTLNEWQILSMCQHPNIVNLVGGIIHGPFDVWLVTQLANGSDLHSRKYSRDPLVRRAITPENGLYMCRQLAAVVAYLHTPIPGVKPVVVHRDIKPENVLVADDWSIQLCDFGDAEASADGTVSRVSGATWFYAPAELLRSCPVERMSAESGGLPLPPFNEKWDIWSMGCVFQEMFGLLNPMHVHISSRAAPNTIYHKLKSKAIGGVLLPDINEGIQGIARTIISKCLNPDPEARPSATEVLEMWNVSDEKILKDINLVPRCSQAAAFMENGTCGQVYQQPNSVLPSGSHTLVSGTTLRRVTRSLGGDPQGLPALQMRAGYQRASDALYGQPPPTTANYLANEALSGTVLNNRTVQHSQDTHPPRSILQAPVPLLNSHNAKPGARCVQLQPPYAATGGDYSSGSFQNLVKPALADTYRESKTLVPQSSSL